MQHWSEIRLSDMYHAAMMSCCVEMVVRKAGVRGVVVYTTPERLSLEHKENRTQH